MTQASRVLAGGTDGDDAAAAGAERAVAEQVTTVRPGMVPDPAVSADCRSSAVVDLYALASSA